MTHAVIYSTVLWYTKGIPKSHGMAVGNARQTSHIHENCQCTVAHQNENNGVKDSD